MSSNKLLGSGNKNFYFCFSLLFFAKIYQTNLLLFEITTKKRFIDKFNLFTQKTYLNFNIVELVSKKFFSA